MEKYDQNPIINSIINPLLTPKSILEFIRLENALKNPKIPKIEGYRYIGVPEKIDLYI